MADRRVATRAAVVSSGALLLAGLGMASAGAAPSGGVAGSTASNAAGAASAVAGAVSGVGSGAAGSVTKSGGKVIKGIGSGKLPAPAKLVKQTTKTVGKVAKTATRTVEGLASGPSGPSHKPNKPTKPNKHKKAAHQPSKSTRSHRSQRTEPVVVKHSQRKPRHNNSAHHSDAARRAGAAEVARLSRADLALPHGDVRGLATVVKPKVAPAPRLNAKASAERPQAGGSLRSFHAGAILPAMEHDSSLQLELLILATVMATGVAGGHILEARRRVTTTVVVPGRR